MKNHQNPEISQIKRIAGQIQGIEKLLNANAGSAAVFQQIEAARGNLKSLEKSLLQKKFKSLKNAEADNSLNYLLKLI